MDAVVLAGGFATRLWPITRHRPKMFLPIGDGTVIDRILADLEGDDRVDRVLVSTNQEFAEAFREYLADSAFEKPSVSVEDTSSEGEKFGVVGALAQLIDREDVTDDMLVIAGDNYIEYDLSTFIDTFEKRDAPTLAAYDVGSRERASSYGIVSLEGERVVGFEEKPDNPESTLVSIACYAFPADGLGLFEEYLEGGNNPDEPGWFIKWLQDRVPTYAFPFDDAWFDIGEPEAYLETVAFHLDGGTKVDSDATVTDSDLGENVLILGDAEVTGASLEGTVVFPGAEIDGATIEGSIIDEQAVVDGVDLTDSLVGAYTNLSE